MKTVFATIQFIDSHSESIRHKNLMVVNNKPLWMYNAEAARALCRPLLVGDTSMPPGGDKYWLKDNWICTTYNDNIIPLDFGPKIPRYAINVDKCKLGDRVAGAVNFLNGSANSRADAYVLLLGNVVSADPKALIMRACESWCAMKQMTPELTGLLSVTNFPMFGPGRALTTEHGLFAKNVSPIDKRFGEEKQDEVSRSWFFDGGVMIMDAKNKLIDNTAIVMSGMRPSDWSECGDFATQFPYLGNCVFALKQNPMDSVEVDDAWQICLLPDINRMEANAAIKHHVDRIEDGQFDHADT